MLDHPLTSQLPAEGQYRPLSSRELPEPVAPENHNEPAVDQ
jgi:hypothetical protein